MGLCLCAKKEKDVIENNSAKSHYYTVVKATNSLKSLQIDSSTKSTSPVTSKTHWEISSLRTRSRTSNKAKIESYLRSKVSSQAISSQPESVFSGLLLHSSGLTSSPTAVGSASRLTLASKYLSSSTMASMSQYSKGSSYPYNNIDTSVNHPGSEYIVVDSRFFGSSKSPRSGEQSSLKSPSRTNRLTINQKKSMTAYRKSVKNQSHYSCKKVVK